MSSLTEIKPVRGSRSRMRYYAKRDLALIDANQLGYGKYLVLGFLLIVYFVMGQPRADVPIRVGEFFKSIGLTFEHASDLWRVRTLVVVTALIGGVAVSSLWCRFLCPGGGLLELIKRFSFFKVYKSEAYNNCDACRRKCYMRTRPEEANCTNCGDCIEHCPQGCIGLGRKPQ